MIRIAQASSSETFTKYGIAPNQRRTGVTAAKPEGNLDGELNVAEFSGGWECVYRPTNAKAAEYIATFMLSAVANGKYIGYSQDNTRFGVFDACKKMTLPNPAMINTPVNCDCATLVGAAVYFSGVKNENLRKLVTSEMESVLMGTGQFAKITDKDVIEKGKGIKRGDILWRTGHTAVSLDTDESYREDLLYFQRYTFKGTAISAGTPGTRATQLSKSISKAGYRPVVARLASVSNSALCNVAPFLGGGNENKLYVNFYRASGSKGTIDTEVMVVFAKNEISAP